MAKKVMEKVTFPLWDFLGLLICYRAHFSVLETVETICVAISLRLTPFFHKMTGLLITVHVGASKMDTTVEFICPL